VVGGSNPPIPTIRFSLESNLSSNHSSSKSPPGVNNFNGFVNTLCKPRDQNPAKLLTILFSLQETLGWSERRLALEIGISNASVSHLKRGRRSLNQRSRILIEAFLTNYSKQFPQIVNFSPRNFAINSMREKKGLDLQSPIDDFLLAKPTTL
jgi:hypothetical protein